MRPSDYWEAKRRLKADLLAFGDDARDARDLSCVCPNGDHDVKGFPLKYVVHTGDDSGGTNTAPLFGRAARRFVGALLSFFGARR